MIFDVIVAGGGHAGIEAAAAAAKLGMNTALITMDKNGLGRLSCNPAIGGSAKGHLVYEIDALGGIIGILADKTGIQFRTLNKSKGPAVWAGRSQADRDYYTVVAGQIMSEVKNLTIIEDSVVDCFVEAGRIKGIKTKKGLEYCCKAFIICSGTFLNGKMFTGEDTTIGGRFGEEAVYGLTESLEKIGFVSGRLKTGTPARLHKDSLNYNLLKEQAGDENPEPFSHKTDKSKFPELPQISCYMTHTDKTVHKILEKGFDKSPLFSGKIEGIGPRYCPSIEDKIVRFSDKESHHIFLEPEGLNSDLIYINGFSSSLPAEIQYEAIRKIKGLEDAVMIRPGYAIEYDFFPPYQIDLTYETKLVKGLYFAGQINGTSGYEEAAAQGLMAGINASLNIMGKEQIVLKRSEAYMGVLIDDLVGKSTTEPYRMFTSRAEHRLILRQDNAAQRLMKYGYELGLIDKDAYNEHLERQTKIQTGLSIMSKTKCKPEHINEYLTKKESTPITEVEGIDKIIKRPNVSLKDILQIEEYMQRPEFTEIASDSKVLEQIEIQLKYEGYIQRQIEAVERFEKLENIKIPEEFVYDAISSISTEGREKLRKVKPRTIGQASRISGVTPSDISVLLVYLKN